MGFGSSIIARLGLDSRDFREGIGSAMSSVKGLAGAVGISFSIAGVIGAAREIVDYGDKINDLSDRYNVNAETLQRIGNVAEKEGSSLEGFARGLNKLLISASGASAGNVELVKAFDDLGITVEDLRKLSPEEIMLKIGKGSMSASSLVKVLGKNALELRPTLKGIADGTKQMGDALSAIDIKKLDEASDILKGLYEKMKIEGGKAIVDMRDDVVRSMNANKQAFDTAKSAAQDLFNVIRGLANHNYSSKGLDDFFDKANDVQRLLRGLGTANAVGVDAKASFTSATASGPDQDSRLLLSLKDLAEKGPGWGRVATRLGVRGWSEGSTAWVGGTMAEGTDEARYKADQARRVLDLEAQARRVNLTGISPTGETAAGLQNRADSIRATIASYLKESDRGTLRGEMDSTEMARNIAIMKDELQRED
jgi:hypothetical protein